MLKILYCKILELFFNFFIIQFDYQNAGQLFYLHYNTMFMKNFLVNYCKYFILLFGIILFFNSTTGYAETYSNKQKTEARGHFNKGVKLFEKGRWQQAMDEFQKGYTTIPHPSLLVNIANCYSKLNNPVEALSYFERYLNETGSTLQDEQRGAINYEITKLRQRVGTITFNNLNKNMEVLIDNNTVTIPDNKNLNVIAGIHRVEVHYNGQSIVKRQIAVEGGRNVEVNISQDNITTSVQQQPSTNESAETENNTSEDIINNEEMQTTTELNQVSEVSGRSSWLPYAEWGGIALSGALLVSSIITFSLSQVRYSDYDGVYQTLQSGVYTSEYEHDLIKARMDEIYYDEFEPLYDSFVGLIISTGIVAAATATIWILDKVFHVFPSNSD